MTDQLDLDSIEAVVRNAAQIGADIDPATAAALVAEVRRLRARVWELERPAVEKQRNEVRDSYAQLAAQCREDRDHEGAFDVDCRLREREEQWKAEDAARQPAAEAPCTLAAAHEPHEWLPFPGSGLVHKGTVRCPGISNAAAPAARSAAV